jgi:hypothetical protein
MGMLVGACHVTTQSNRRDSAQRSSGATTGPANTVREDRQHIAASNGCRTLTSERLAHVLQEEWTTWARDRIYPSPQEFEDHHRR